MVEVGGIPCHRDADVGEARHEQARLHGEGVDRRGRRAQLVDHGLRLEDAAVIRERGERRRRRARCRSACACAPHELGIHDELAVQLQLEVGLMPPDREGTQQHRRGAGESADPPRRQPDREVHRLETAGRAQFEVLGRDPLGGQPRGAQRDLVAEQVREQCRSPGDELRKAARMRLGDLDRCVGRIREVQQGRPAAERRGLPSQPVPLGLCDMTHCHVGLREPEIAGGHHGPGLGSVFAGHGGAFCSPHTSQTRRGRHAALAGDPSFAVLSNAADQRFLPRSAGARVVHTHAIATLWRRGYGARMVA